MISSGLDVVYFITCLGKNKKKLKNNNLLEYTGTSRTSITTCNAEAQTDEESMKSQWEGFND